MKTYHAYSPFAPTEIRGEVHTIKDGQIMLKNIPFENSIDIAGFKQTTNANILPNQFYCSYGANEYYRESNCVVYFNSIHDGETVSVDYLQVGTIIIAEDLNEIKAHLENETIHTAIKDIPIASSVEAGLVRISDQFRMNGDILTFVGTIGGAAGGNIQPYTLHPATTDSLGGVIVGNGFSVGADGRIDVTLQSGNNFTLTAATEDSLGGIMVGNNLSIDNGTLSSFFYLDTIPSTIDGAMWLQF